VLAPEHLLELRALHRLLEGVEGRGNVLLDVFAALQPLDEDAGVVLLPLEPLQEVEVGLQALAPLEDLLGRLGVLPEVLGRQAALDLVQLAAELVGLKDSRGRPRPSRPASRSAGSGLKPNAPPSAF